MLEVAIEKAKTLKMNVKYTCRTPGVFDMPLVIDTLLKKDEVDAVVTLGAIIKGHTKHDELIANSTTRALVELSIKYRKPVTVGISGPAMSDGQPQQGIRPGAETPVEADLRIGGELQRK